MLYIACCASCAVFRASHVASCMLHVYLARCMGHIAWGTLHGAGMSSASHRTGVSELLDVLVGNLGDEHESEKAREKFKVR